MKVQKYIASMLGVLMISGSLSALGAERCVNFSGNWAGTCRSSQGQVRQEQTSVAQNGCQAISVDGRFFIFGEVIETHVPSGHYNVSYEKFDFNPSGTEMQYDFVGMFKKHFSNDSTVSVSVKTHYAMRNGRLIRSLTDNLTGFSETCTFFRH